jgi:hypothetical protein
MTDTAVDKIMSNYENFFEMKITHGIVGLDADTDGEIPTSSEK